MVLLLKENINTIWQSPPMAPNHHQTSYKTKIPGGGENDPHQHLLHSSFFKPQNVVDNLLHSFSSNRCLLHCLNAASSAIYLRAREPQGRIDGVQTPPLPKRGDVGAAGDAGRAQQSTGKGEGGTHINNSWGLEEG